MTSALNATLVTGNGNEMILQNDMGNTLIEDSITGHVMGLNDGFIPVGMKEYGGILYIASYNPQTGDGELGTIPSPNIKYSELFEENTIKENIVPIADLKDILQDPLIPNINQALIKITDHIMYPGDQYIVLLDIENLDKTITRGTKVYPLFSEFAYDKEGNMFENTGYYKVELWARLESGRDVLLESIIRKPQEYYLYDKVEATQSKYWFIPKPADESNLDFNRTLKQHLFRVYPNIPRGYLAVKVILETPKNIQLKENTSTLVRTPYTFSVDPTDQKIDAYSAQTGELIPHPKGDANLKPELLVK